MTGTASCAPFYIANSSNIGRLHSVCWWKQSVSGGHGPHDHVAILVVNIAGERGKRSLGR